MRELLQVWRGQATARRYRGGETSAGAAGAAAGHRAGGLAARGGGRNRAAARNQALPPPGQAAGTPARRGRTQPRPVPSLPSRPVRDPLRGRAAALGSRWGGSGRGLRPVPAPRPAPPRPHPRGRPLRCGGRASAGAGGRRRGPSVQPSVPRSASAALRPPLPAPLHPSPHPSLQPSARPSASRAVPARSWRGGRASSAAWWKVGPAGAAAGARAPPEHCRGWPGTPGAHRGRGGLPAPEPNAPGTPGMGEAAPRAPAPHWIRPRVGDQHPRSSPAHCRALRAPRVSRHSPAPSTALWPCRQRSAVASSLPWARGRHPLRALLPLPAAGWRLSPCPAPLSPCPAPLSSCSCSTAPLELREAGHLLVKSISTFSGSTSPRCSPLPAALPRREEAKTPSKCTQIK